MSTWQLTGGSNWHLTTSSNLHMSRLIRYPKWRPTITDIWAQIDVLNAIWDAVDAQRCHHRLLLITSNSISNIASVHDTPRKSSKTKFTQTPETPHIEQLMKPKRRIAISQYLKLVWEDSVPRAESHRNNLLSSTFKLFPPFLKHRHFLHLYIFVPYLYNLFISAIL